MFGKKERAPPKGTNGAPPFRMINPLNRKLFHKEKPATGEVASKE